MQQRGRGRSLSGRCAWVSRSIPAGDVARCGRAASRRACGRTALQVVAGEEAERGPAGGLGPSQGLNDAADPAHVGEPGDGSAGPARWARLLSGAGSNDALARRMNPAVITYMLYKSIAE